MLAQAQTHILDFETHLYPYWEDVNEGILRQFPEAHGTNTDVLDVGCGQGVLAGAIKDKGYTVYGIECEPSAVLKARPRTHQVIEADLHDLKTIKATLGEKRFDYIIFSDVLEHVYDPLGTMRSYTSLLKPHGKILISLPNIANWEARLKLFFGIFRYSSSGVMDRTHIRFFTFKTAREMVQAGGLKVAKEDCTPYIIRAFVPIIKKILSPKQDDQVKVEARRGIIDSPFYRFYEKFIYPIEYGLTRLFPGLFTFRIILVGEKE